MLEKEIEAYLTGKVKRMGGRAYKFTSPGNSGVPDRIVMLPDGAICFVELKAPGKKPSPLQEAQMRRIQSLGQKVFVIDSKEKVDRLIERGLRTCS